MRSAAWLCVLGLLAAPALAGPADVPQFQYFYAVPGADLVWTVAPDPSGTLRAGGLGSLQVLSFSRDGELLGGWPVGAGPQDVAVAGDGTVWVSAPARGDVRSYSPGGLEQVIVPGASGALAVAPGGEVFVASAYDVRRFGPDGAPAGAWPFCLSHACLGVTVRGVAVGPDTTVYVSVDDSGQHFVTWFLPSAGSGTLAWPWAGRSPRGLALDASTGELFVAFHSDPNGPDGVVKYSAARDTVGTAWLPPAAQVLGGIAVDGAGHLHVPTWLGVARFGLGTDPARRTTWGALKQLRR